MQFISRCPSGKLKFYEVEGGLKEFTTTEKDMQHKISRCPEESRRNTELEVMGEEYKGEDGLLPEDKEDKFSQGPTAANTVEDNDDDDDDGMLDTRGTVLMYKGSSNKTDVSLEDFNVKGVIGRGTFGKVFLAELRSTGKAYAIKQL